MSEAIRCILVANRGEIAARILTACREMGLRAAAVYSEADRHAPYLALADSAHCIGPAAVTESYLSIPAVLEAARKAGADAVHPGYGFLSENPLFAEELEKTGIRFIGPPSGVIRSLGDKIAAKKLMESAGVPVVPGFYGESPSDKRLNDEAKGLGFPLLIKASAGGGGRGMRLVESADQFQNGLDEARKEAEAGFGDSRVLLERYVPRPRHVEIQIVGDAHGKVIHLFERECSIQRRHQKIIEESPSPVMTQELRSRMTEAAVAAGKAAGYISAGTVEFLVEERPDGNHGFYFLEVNTRLQVEHPVTETITGIDLVKLQIRIACGDRIPFEQADIRSTGHAMEARIYAEDPESGFLPSIGTLDRWIPPAGPWIRVDSGVESGSVVSSHYDPMLAKLIVRGENRDECLAGLERALTEFHALGVKTNIPFLLAIVRDDAFRAGAIHTGFLGERLGKWKRTNGIPKEVLLALGALATSERRIQSVDARAPESDPDSPWRSAAGWRN